MNVHPDLLAIVDRLRVRATARRSSSILHIVAAPSSDKPRCYIAHDLRAPTARELHEAHRICQDCAFREGLAPETGRRFRPAVEQREISQPTHELGLAMPDEAEE